MQPGSTVGPWKLGEQIDRGGNATVWSARRSGRGKPVALKVIHATKAQRESYRRFVQEIEFLRTKKDDPGVLPLLDAYLPDRPTSTDRPWLAMPIATPIRAALDGKPLHDVVEALRQIAETLARLAAESIGHRDIKPGNLYELDGRWLVGDFGLVAAPDLDEMTREGKALGPAHFTAYEMIRDPVGADPLPADVYSFAKTLWVLATAQLWPPEGHQAANTRGFSIAALRPHPHADALDRLVDRSTLLHPEDRPTMTEVASDLQAWQLLRGGPSAIEVSDLGARFRAKVEREIAAEDLLQQRKDMAHQASRRLTELLAPLNAALAAIHPRAEINLMPDKYAHNMLKTYRESGAPEIAFNFGRRSRLATGDPHFAFELVMGSGVELTVDGELIFRAFIRVGHHSIGGAPYRWDLSPPSTAPVGSVEAERMLEAGVSELQARLLEALEVFVAEAPAR